MEFGKRRSLANARNSTKLQIYKTPPVHTISLGEFEELAFSRLKCELHYFEVEVVDLR